MPLAANTAIARNRSEEAGAPGSVRTLSASSAQVTVKLTAA